MSTCQVSVIYKAPIASSLLSHFISAISGGALYQKASFLLDHLGKPIFPDFVGIHEPLVLKGAMGSPAYGSEGVATAVRNIVQDGVLLGYVLGSYSARRLRAETTGNARGVYNLYDSFWPVGFDDTIKSVSTGFWWPNSSALASIT